jgi:stearoyl-CoA desaturase (delta-9 desaturase)
MLPEGFTWMTDTMNERSVGTFDLEAGAGLAPMGKRGPDERINRVTSLPFIFIHLVPLAAVFTGVSLRAVLLGVGLFYLRMFFITAGYHRYFSHRSYKMGRAAQFVMAFGGGTAAQKGALWWAAHHRDHHKYSDTDADIHSPQKGFWWSHVGWILCDKYAATDYDRIRDFAKYPELRWLNKWDFVPPWALAVTCFLVAGWSGLVIGFVASTVALWHATFTINSLAHVIGRRRYATTDTSRNTALLVPITMGEGWHNNHHYFQASARQGFFWWEIDPSYAVLKVLSWMRIVRDLKVPPKSILAANRIDNGSFDIGMFRSHWRKASGAVHAAQASIGHRVHDRRVGTADALSTRRASIEATLTDKKQSLEGFVHHSLESAEELARLARKGERELGLVE